MHVTLWEYDVSLNEDVIDAPEETIRQRVREYERGKRTSFDLDVKFPNSFTGSVMEAMLTIPYGETRTYGEIATELDTSPVAVGQACGSNPIPLIVPCHRVVGANSLGGFSAGGERGLELKRALLTHEREGAEGGQSQLSAYRSGER